MSDELGRVADFVKAGAAAQAAVDKLTAGAVDARARACRAAAVAGAQVGLTRKALESAIRSSSDARVMRAHVQHALTELDALAAHLLEHFTLLGVDPPSVELSRAPKP